MTDRQLALLHPGPATGGLNPRQELALAILADHPEGLRASDVGIAMHIALDRSCRCQTGPVCDWAASEATQVLKSLRARELAIQRRNAGWQLMQPVREPPGDFPPGF